MGRYGRWASGGPFTLQHQMEYTEDADFEVCVPLRSPPPDRVGREPAGQEAWSVRMLPARRCLVTVHRGHYQDIGRAYARLMRARQGTGTPSGPASLLPY